VKGVLVTGEQNREGNVVGEILSVFNFFARLLYPHLVEAHEKAKQEEKNKETLTKEKEKEKVKEKEKETEKEKEGEEDSNEKKKVKEMELEQEEAETGNVASTKLFEVINPGCQGMAFISFKQAEIHPVKFVHAILTHILEGKEPKHPFKLEHASRLLPLTAVGEATTTNALLELVFPVVDEYFKDKPCIKFSVRIESRNNDTLTADKMKIIEKVAEHIGSTHKVDLSNPELVVTIQVFKSAAGVGVYHEHVKLRKYNLNEVSIANQEKKE